MIYFRSGLFINKPKIFLKHQIRLDNMLMSGDVLEVTPANLWYAGLTAHLIHVHQNS